MEEEGQQGPETQQGPEPPKESKGQEKKEKSDAKGEDKGDDKGNDKGDGKGDKGGGDGDKGGGKDTGLGAKRTREECGWVCACTLALGGFLACFFFNLYIVIRVTQLPKDMGMEGLLIMTMTSLIVALVGGGFVCAAIWYRVRRELEWALVCVVGAGAMGVALGFFGLFIFVVVPVSMSNAESRAEYALREDFVKFKYDMENMIDEVNFMDSVQKNFHCCGIVGPGDYPHYLKMDPPPSCCAEDPFQNQTGKCPRLPSLLTLLRRRSENLARVLEAVLVRILARVLEAVFVRIMARILVRVLDVSCMILHDFRSFVV